MRKEFENYGDVQRSLEEARDNLEVLIHDCEKSAEEERVRILDDAREASYYAEFLEKLMREHDFNAAEKQTLRLAAYWLSLMVRRKEEI